VLLLTACGEENVHSACYKNGDHANMSDGRITRICDCIDSTLKNTKPTPQQIQLAIAWLKGQPLESKSPQAKYAAADIAAAMKRIKPYCEGTK